MSQEAPPPPARRESARWLHEHLLAERRAVIKMMESHHEQLIAMWGENTGLASETDGQGEGAGAPPPPWPDGAPPALCPEEKAQVCVDEDLESMYVDVPEENQADGVKGEASGGAKELRRSMTSNSTMSPLVTQGGCLRRIAVSWQFEVLFAVLITLNALVLMAERQAQGLKTSEILHGLEGDWATGDAVFNALEWLFGILFCVEILMKIAVLKTDFVRLWWNSFDLLVVVVWCIDRAKLLAFGNVMALRLMRLMRIARLLRLLSVSAVFDPLILLIKSIRASVHVLGWSILLLNLVVAIVAMTFSELLEEWIRHGDAPIEKRRLIYESFGSFTRATETMYEVTLANWGPPCRLLMNNVSEWWALVFVLYKLCIGFAVVQVVISVFIQQTFKVAARDEDLMIREKRATRSHYVGHLSRLFRRMDKSGDGRLNREELDEVLQDDGIKEWFDALEIDFEEAEALFDALGDGDGLVSKEEFLAGVKAVKASAKQTDIMYLAREAKTTRKLLTVIQSKVEDISLTSQYGAEYVVMV